MRSTSERSARVQRLLRRVGTTLTCAALAAPILYILATGDLSVGTALRVIFFYTLLAALLLWQRRG